MGTLNSRMCVEHRPWVCTHTDTRTRADIHTHTHRVGIAHTLNSRMCAEHRFWVPNPTPYTQTFTRTRANTHQVGIHNTPGSQEPFF